MATTADQPTRALYVVVWAEFFAVIFVMMAVLILAFDVPPV